MIGLLLGLPRLVQIVGLMVAVFGAFLAWNTVDNHFVEKRARAERDAEIKEINDAYINRATSARAAALACLDAGGVWRSATGVCTDPD